MNVRDTVIIILAWNGKPYLEACLNSVFQQTYAHFRAIVVDNGSSDGSADFVNATFPQVEVIRNNRNLGYSAGNNIGLRAATGDMMVLLNQDTVVDQGWLSALVEVAKSNPEAGIIGAKTLYANGLVQHAGGYVNRRGETGHYGYRCPGTDEFEQLRDVDFVTGATMAITREALGAIGELDEGFTPAYYEDVDLCYRARREGFRVIYAPHALAKHEEASAFAQADPESVFSMQRNRLRFVLKHWPISRLVEEFVPTEAQALRDLQEGGQHLVTALQRSYLYHLLHLSEIMSWRQRLYQAPAVEFEAIADSLQRLRAVVPLRPAQPRPLVFPAEPIFSEHLINLTMDAKVLPPIIVAGDSASALPNDGTSVASSDSQVIPDSDVGGMPAHELQQPEFPTLQAMPRQTEILIGLHQKWSLHEHRFRSAIPVVGRLIAGFRHWWNNISTRWYVQPLIKEQSHFNSLVVQAITNLSQHCQATDGLILKQAEWLEAQTRWLNTYMRELPLLRLALQQQLHGERNQSAQVNAMITRLREQIAGHELQVRQLIEQISLQNSLLQQLINQASTHQKLLVELEDNRQRLADVLAEYISEDGREIAELAREIQRLDDSSERTRDVDLH